MVTDPHELIDSRILWLSKRPKRYVHGLVLAYIRPRQSALKHLPNDWDEKIRPYEKKLQTRARFISLMNCHKGRLLCKHYISEDSTEHVYSTVLWEHVKAQFLNPEVKFWFYLPSAEMQGSQQCYNLYYADLKTAVYFRLKANQALAMNSSLAGSIRGEEQVKKIVKMMNYGKWSFT